MTTAEMIEKLHEAKTLVDQVASTMDLGATPCSECKRNTHDNHDDVYGHERLSAISKRLEEVAAKLATNWKGRSFNK